MKNEHQNNFIYFLLNIFFIYNPVSLLNRARKDFLMAWRNYREAFGGKVIIVYFISIFSLIFLVANLNDYIFNPPLTMEQMNKDAGSLIRFDKARKGPAYSLLLDFNGETKSFTLYLGQNREQKKAVLSDCLGKNVTVWSERQFVLFFWKKNAEQIACNGKYFFKDSEIEGRYYRGVEIREKSPSWILIEAITGLGPLLYIWIYYRNNN
ncbi:hypothetical protein [Methylomonas methanica]|uniref:Uncharacterized protein n=1 Tax=Methylomonas methanica (strain DSM 25384 / MC09) TaxID=857087 RepID=F9ZWN8_METMM|nr:hypothetical protein [Methylomonas methanica]AEG00885.1 hypothetical protein Metme_2493 [Methylomonas methanica MC09]